MSHFHKFAENIVQHHLLIRSGDFFRYCLLAIKQKLVKMV